MDFDGVGWSWMDLNDNPWIGMDFDRFEWMSMDLPSMDLEFHAFEWI